MPNTTNAPLVCHCLLGMPSGIRTSLVSQQSAKRHKMCDTKKRQTPESTYCIPKIGEETIRNPSESCRSTKCQTRSALHVTTCVVKWPFGIRPRHASQRVPNTANAPLVCHSFLGRPYGIRTSLVCQRSTKHRSALLLSPSLAKKRNEIRTVGLHDEVPNATVHFC